MRHAFPLARARIPAATVRPMVRPAAALVVGVAGGWILASGCAANGSRDHLNGPGFDLDASAGGDTSAPVDGSAPPPLLDGAARDSSLPDSSLLDARPAADATTPGEAGDASAPDAGCASTTAILG